MKNNFSIAIIFCLAGMSFSCTQIISLDIPNSDPVLVVQGEILSTQDSSYVQLTKTVSYYSTDVIPAVDNASVSVLFNGNTVVFKSKGDGIYKPDSGFLGTVNTQYNLNVNYNGTNYTASSFMDPMFNIDYVDSVYEPGNGGGGGPGGGRNSSGYRVRFWWMDTRPNGKYTYIRYGHTLTDFAQDSFLRNIILLDNSQTKLNAEISYNLGRRYQQGDTVFAVLKSCDYNMFYFLQSYRTQTSNAPGPFQTPRANLPTNISGGAIGFFAASDVRRFRKGL
ncbi:MAG: DUF4249 family protein [Bacteroidia bacterium]